MTLTGLTNLQPLHIKTVGIGTFDNAVSIGGTLTYEDVTNVDAIGIITARSDLSIADKIIHTGDTNTAIRFPAADTFTVETNNTERFRIGSNGYIGVGNFSSKSRTDPLNVDSGIGTCNIGGNYIHLSRYSGGGTNYITAPQNNANLHISADDFISIGVDHSSSIYTHNTEAIRIISNGAVGINTDVSGNGGGAKLVVGGRIQSNAGGYWFAGANGAEDGWHVQDSGGNFAVVESGVAERLRIHSSGTLQAFNHLTSRNGIVQINQVTSTTRYSGSGASVDLITGSTFTPKTSAPRFLIMIFCPVNTSDDSDAGGGNTNFYYYGRIEYRKNGGSWLECNNQGSTAQQGGFAAHVELSPNRTGPNTTDYWTGNRYRMAHKNATILVTNVGDCGLNGTVQFKLRSYSQNGNFIQIGQPHGNGTDDDYSVHPWGFTVFELAPDSNSYTAY